MGEATEKTNKTEQNPGEELRKLLDTPMTQDEAQKNLAEINVQIAQLTALRLRKTMEVNGIDQQLAAAEFEKSVIYRRCMNPVPKAEQAEEAK